MADTRVEFPLFDSGLFRNQLYLRLPDIGETPEYDHRSGQRIEAVWPPRRDVLAAVYPALYERVVAHEQAEQFGEWRQCLRAAVPDVNDLSVEPFSSPEYFYWNDPVHFTEAAAEKIIDMILGIKGMPLSSPIAA